MIRAFVLLLFILFAASCAGNVLNFKTVYIEFGGNIGHHVESRILGHLNLVNGTKVFHISEFDDREVDLNHKSLIISLGNAPWSSKLIPRSELLEMPDESFNIVFKAISSTGNTFVVASNGLPLADHTHKNISFDRNSVHYGAVLGAYVTLEHLGFAFLHPLEPYIPPILRLDTKNCETNKVTETPDCVLGFQQIESPHWPERAFHIHTQHPLEVTEVLQGHDVPQFGPHGPHCKIFNKTHNRLSKQERSQLGSHAYCERWEDMVPDVDAMFEWALANRLNKIEWLLLGNYKWGDELDTKRRRLSVLTGLGHQYSLLVGADCPMGNIQQHGWHIVNVRLPFAQQVMQIEQRVDWIFNAGFDFLTTESGLSEFTHPECDLMVDLMNAFSIYANVTWGREAGIKVHCSRGQKCTGYPDPRTGDPLNFNFLPTFAHPSMGVFPHTVQMYGLDDPTGGTYGNRDFGYMEDYLVYEAKKGQRSVVFYGETAYWVNYDVDVPLFLPLYAQRRLHDLRRIAVREIREDFRIQGQMNFDSGWEWGYWLNDVVTARASWDPLLPSDKEKIRTTTDRPRDPDVPTTGDILDTCNNAAHQCADSTLYSAADDQWAAYEMSLKPVVKIFGPIYAQRVSDLLLRLTKAQEQLLIFGRVEGRVSPDLTKLSGIAYMAGGDTWMDVPRMFGLAFTQPDKVYLRENDDPLWADVLMLLKALHETFRDISAAFSGLVAEMKTGQQVVEPEGGFEINGPAWKLLEEVEDCIRMLALRAEQMRLLYDSRDPVIGADEAVKDALQKQARGVLHNAAQIVLRREENYRVAVERVGAWRDNPTVYRFGYLWSVHTLYYWWRDQGLAEQGSLQSEYSPCYLNRMDSTEVAVGWGRYTLQILRNFVNRYTFTSSYPLEIVNCLSPPPKAYEFPKNLYHSDN
jgi:hypothetical protein